jgi:hypothetical protein
VRSLSCLAIAWLRLLPQGVAKIVATLEIKQPMGETTAQVYLHHCPVFLLAMLISNKEPRSLLELTTNVSSVDPMNADQSLTIFPQLSSQPSQVKCNSRSLLRSYHRSSLLLHSFGISLSELISMSLGYVWQQYLYHLIRTSFGNILINCNKLLHPSQYISRILVRVA